MRMKDADGVSMLLAAIERAAVYDNLDRIKALTIAGFAWSEAQDAEAERTAWRAIEEAAGWVGKFNPAE